MRVLVAAESLGGFPEIPLTDDVVAFEDRACLVPTDLHGHALRDASPDHVPDSRAPQIVEESAGIHR